MISRDWLLIEGRPWREREELEAETLELRAALARLHDHLLQVLIEAERRTGRPRKAEAQIGKRHARWLRARQPTFRDLLLALDEPLHFDFTQPACDELRAAGMRWQLCEEKKRR